MKRSYPRQRAQDELRCGGQDQVINKVPVVLHTCCPGTLFPIDPDSFDLGWPRALISTDQEHQEIVWSQMHRPEKRIIIAREEKFFIFR